MRGRRQSVTHLLTLVLGLAVGCAGDSVGPAPPPPPPGTSLDLVSGDLQIGFAGQVLAEPLVVRAVDAQGQPAPGIGVSWRAEQNGALESADPETGPDGTARAQFRLGGSAGAAAASAEITGGPAVRFELAAVPPSHDLGPGERAGLQFMTFDGSGQVVHPDYAATLGLGAPRQLAITPYPNGNPGFELPSLFSGWDGVEWILGPGVPNPIEPLPAGGYLSDPDLVYLAESRELWLYYRAVTTGNLIYLVRSSDEGRNWTGPELVISAPSHDVISPAVVRRAPGDWWMWSVNGGPIGCGAPSTTLEVRRSMDGHHWGPPQTLAVGDAALSPWHVDVQWIPSRNEFWALYNSKEPGSCTTPVLFLATSPDGVHWTTAPDPVMVKGDLPAFRDIVYRSTFEYRPDQDDVLFWYSGARYADGRWTWSAAADRRLRRDLFAAGLARRELRFEPAPAPLVDWP